MSTIRITWTDSVSSDVIGHKIYRDDVEIASVGLGVETYDDDTVVMGVTYKYEVQAFTSQTESTDEVAGVNTDSIATSIYALPTSIAVEVSEAFEKPILTNFRIEAGQPSRVYFDSNRLLDPTKTSITGFSFYTGTPNEGTKSATGALSINSGSLTGHYITLDSSCDWSTIMTIDYDGTGTVGDVDNSVSAFTLTEVINNITIPAATRTRYVSPSGGGNGESIGSPWTMVQGAANAQAGDIIYIAPGTYSMTGTGYVFTKSGNINAPIRYVGYNATPGDDPVFNFSYPSNVTPDANLMPLITGAANGIRGGERGINNSGSYVIFKNIQIEGYRGVDNNTTSGQCFYSSGGVDVVHLDNIFTKDSKRGIYFNSPSSARIQIKNSTCFAHYSKGILIGVDSFHASTVDGGNNRIFNTEVHDDIAYSDNETDYFIKTNNVNSIISQCHIYKHSWGQHAGSGIVLKGDQTNTANNLIVDCTAKNMKMPLQARHSEVNNNVYKNCTIINDEAGADLGGMLVVNGASYNIFENCKVIGGRYFVALNSSTEQPNQVGNHHNEFRNCIADDVSNVIECDQYNGGVPTTEFNNNKWLNCTFTDCSNLIGLFDNNLDNTNQWVNNIINNVTNKVGSGSGTDSSVYTNNLYYNSYTAEGTGAITGVDPLLDANYQPQADFESIDAAKVNEVDYDYNNSERASATTVGAIKHVSELIGGEVAPPVSQTYIFDGSATSYFETDFDISTLTDNNSFVYKGKLTNVTTLDFAGSKVNGEFYNRYVLGGSLQARYYDGATGDITVSYTKDTDEHTFIFTMDSSINRLRVYVDGVLLQEDTDSGFDGWDGRSSLLLIGARNNPAMEMLDGELSNVQIYNKELTQGEITALQTDITDTATGLVANFADNKVLNTWTDDVSGYIATNQGGITIV